VGRLISYLARSVVEKERRRGEDNNNDQKRENRHYTIMDKNG
jgi:hypothetical protein